MIDLNVAAPKKGILSRLYRKLAIQSAMKRGLSIMVRVIYRKKSYSRFGIPRGRTFISERVVEIIPEEKVILDTPQSINEASLSAFGKEQVLTKGAILNIKNGMAISPGGNLTPEGRLIMNPLFCPGPPAILRHFRYTSKKFFPRIFETNEEVANLTHEQHLLFFHWVFEVLPRLHLIKKDSKFFINNGTSYQKESLDLLGISKERVIGTQDYDAVKTPSLIATGAPYGPTKWGCDYLRQSFLPKLKKSGKKRRLYISRNDAKRRRLLNEEEVFSCLAKYGFEKMTLAPLSFKEQAEAFYNAEIVVGPHGAGLSHLVFCDPKTKVLELFASSYVIYCYWLLSNFIPLSYFYLLGKNENQKGKHALFDDFSLDLKELEATLRLMKCF